MSMESSGMLSFGSLETRGLAPHLLRSLDRDSLDRNEMEVLLGRLYESARLGRIPVRSHRGQTPSNPPLQVRRLRHRFPSETSTSRTPRRKTRPTTPPAVSGCTKSTRPSSSARSRSSNDLLRTDAFANGTITCSTHSSFIPSTNSSGVLFDEVRTRSQYQAGAGQEKTKKKFRKLSLLKHSILQRSYYSQMLTQKTMTSRAREMR